VPPPLSQPTTATATRAAPSTANDRLRIASSRSG
jgi:hypothetical protein